MPNYKHNTPTFNSDRKVANFNDFVSNLPNELDELKKVKRSFRHEEGEVGNIPNKSKYKYNKVTHKMDDLSKDEVQDKIDAIEVDLTNESRYWLSPSKEAQLAELVTRNDDVGKLARIIEELGDQIGKKSGDDLKVYNRHVKLDGVWR